MKDMSPLPPIPQVSSSLQDVALGLVTLLAFTFMSPVLLRHTVSMQYCNISQLKTKTAPFSPPSSYVTISLFPLGWDKTKALAWITVSSGLKGLFEAH